MSTYIDVPIDETCDDHPDVQLERLVKVSPADGWDDERTTKTVTVTCPRCKIESKRADWDAE